MVCKIKCKTAEKYLNVCERDEKRRKRWSSSFPYCTVNHSYLKKSLIENIIFTIRKSVESIPFNVHLKINKHCPSRLFYILNKLHHKYFSNNFRNFDNQLFFSNSSFLLKWRRSQVWDQKRRYEHFRFFHWLPLNINFP